MLKFLSCMLCTSRIHPFSLGNYLITSLIIENLIIIRVISVEWTWLGLEWPLVCCLVQYMGEIVPLCTLLHSCSLQFNLLQSPIQWSVDFALVDERKKSRM
jgi:hypothetical protein